MPWTLRFAFAIADFNKALELDGQYAYAYCDRAGVKFWIITESDRSVTTTLLPEDY